MMTYMILKGLTLTACLSLISLFPLPSIANETYVIEEAKEIVNTHFTKYTWLTTLHPKVASFTALDNGDFFGRTTTGVPFFQHSILNSEGIRIQRFEIEDHFHFIVEGTIIGSLEALSAQLASVYESRQ